MADERAPEDPWNVTTDGEGHVEEGMALAAGAALRPLYEHIKASLPPGVHFALIIELPGEDGSDGRIAAMSTNRTYMAPRAAEWFLSVVGPN